MTLSSVQKPHFLYKNIFQKRLFFGLVFIVIAHFYQIFILHHYSPLLTLSAVTGLFLISLLGKQGFISASILQAITGLWLFLDGIYPFLILVLLQALVLVAFLLTWMTLCFREEKQIEAVSSEVNIDQGSAQLRTCLKSTDAQQKPEANGSFSLCEDFCCTDDPSHVSPGEHLSSEQEQKDKLWQELFEARQEITALYQQVQKNTAVEELMQVKEEELRVTIDAHNTLKIAYKELEEKFNDPFEARYHQLRQQFEQKSQILDETRQELFQMQEKHEILSRSFADKVRSIQHEHEETFLKSLQEACSERQELQREYREEVSRLETLVETLLLQLRDTKA